MSKRELFPDLPDRWETISWEKSPHDEGIFVSKVEEKYYSKSKIPKYTIMALKINPGCTIDRHIHLRESNWQETLTLLKGGNFEILGKHESSKFLIRHKFSKTVHAKEVFGIRNLDTTQPLYFYSRMEPGFTGYSEIEKIKAK